jgi:glycyl-tRNA synthetase
MEMQYFHHPSQTVEYFKMWQEYRWQWYLDHGIPTEKLQWYQHEKLAHYASDAYDIKYNFACFDKFDEIEGIHARPLSGPNDLGRFSFWMSAAEVTLSRRLLEP